MNRLSQITTRVLPLAMGLLIGLGSLSAVFADAIGTVDYEKLLQSYNKAQSFSDDSKIKERDLEKMRAEYVKQLRETKSKQPNNPVALDQMEKDLQDKLNSKINETRDWMAAKSKELETEMNTAISSVAAAKKLDIVIAKQFVFHGGQDITTDVIGRLNAMATPAR